MIIGWGGGERGSEGGLDAEEMRRRKKRKKDERREEEEEEEEEIEIYGTGF